MTTPEAPLTDIATGLGLPESVRWAGDAIWFADWTAGALHRYDLHARRDEVVARVPALPLCFDVDGDTLTVFDGPRQRLLVGPAGERWRRAIDLSGLGARAGNEVIAAPRGGWYLNFGNFDPAQGFPTSPVGLIVHVAPDGDARIVAERLAFPNGMAISPAGDELIVAESHAGRLTSFRIGADGALSDRATWAAVDGSAPDGIAMGAAGTVWYADVANTSVTEVARGGAIIRTISTGSGAFSCALSPDAARLAVARANWPGPARMFDPSHTWDGAISIVEL